MKICPECGASNSDSYKFCMACGATLGNETVPDAEVPAIAEPVSSYSSSASCGCGATLNGIMSGKSVLAAAILTTVAFAASVFSMFTAGSVLSSLMGNIDSLIGFLYQSGIVPFSDMNSMFVFSGVDPSAVSGNFSISYRIDIIGLLVPVVLWIIWGTARSGKLSKSVFTVLKVLAIIGLVLCCIAALIIVAASVFAAVYIPSNVDFSALPFNPSGAIIVFACAAALFACLTVYVNICKVNTAGSIAKACGGAYNGKISVVTAAMFMYSGVRTVIFALLGAAVNSAVNPMLLVDSAGSVCTGIAYALIGYVIVKTKTLLAKEQ